MNLDTVKTDKPLYVELPKDVFASRHISDKPVSMLRCHYHRVYEIYYMNKGERYYFIKDKLYHIKDGDMVFISPNEIHATLNVKNGLVDRMLVNFDKTFIQESARMFDDINFFEVFEENIAIVTFENKERLAVEKLLSDITKEYEGQNSLAKQRLMLLELLRQVNENKARLGENGLPGPSYVHKTITDVIGYINNNYELDLTLENVSNKFFISPCYLSRTFKRTVNVSFVDYINNVRVMEAKKLLALSNKNIMQVGECVGFKSNTHFGRIFKKITGVSPLQFRNQKLS